MDSEKVKQDFFAGFSKLKNQSLWKGCFHENSDCSKEIIKAHSIQNNRILNYISEDGNVLMFGPELNNSLDLKTTMKPQGRKKATTFTGFCGKHDSDLFRPIEYTEYVPGNKEQEFLFAYRALAKEYHAKKSTAEISRKSLGFLENGDYSSLSKLFDDGSPPGKEHVEFMTSMFDSHMSGTNEAVKAFEKQRAAMNINLENGRYFKIQTECIVFDKEYHLAVSAVCNIENDLLGNRINDYGKLNVPLAPLFVTIFPQNGKTFVLLSYYKNDKFKFEFIKKQIVAKEPEEQAIIISNIVISHVENFVVSPIKWRELGAKKQEKIASAFMETALTFNKPLVFDNTLNIFI
ncbi:hypothetical protein [Domibacillus tundrae]|uniref:hypothetical protein n=1 Tax=Domibacillus tundrae TaxID=1587527 RepID=UPI0006990F1E|nr:hypothetical protein [Domibacillus tundrae]